MLEKLNKNPKLYVLKGIFTLGTLLTVICLSVGVLIGNRTFGWFSQNKEVEANGMQVSVEGFDVDVKFYIWNGTEYLEDPNDLSTAFAGLVPGDRIYVKAVLSNGEETPFKVNASLDPVKEEPKVEDDKYYYLGTQLKLIYAGVSDPTNPENADAVAGYDQKFLAPNTGSEVEFAAGTPVTPEKITMVAPFDLGASNATADFYFVIEFADFPVSQNAYAEFPENNCIRCLTFSFEKPATS